ncbi:MAG TPA: S8 family serine peptidase [Casimicrobiaceae bacterium]|nr:S8 family serine peptidase [Casimicrobiaceae bacterium]
MHLRLLIAIVVLPLAFNAAAQGKKRVEKAADLPVFSYKVDGKLETLIRDDAKFRTFAADVRRDTDSVLAGYEIADKAKLRELLGVLVRLDLIEGRWDSALSGALRIRELEEKPADKLLSGLVVRAIVEARRVTGSTTADAYRREVSRLVAADLAGMPYEVIQNEIKEAKAGNEILSEALAMGYVNNVLQQTVDKAGSLSSDLAPIVVGAKYRLTFALPLKETMVATYTQYLDAHKVEKPDIWAARNVELAAGKDYTPVTIAVWDSGVDSALFKGRMVLDASGKPALLAFDKYSNPAAGELAPIPAELKGKLPQMKARLKGFSDLQSNIDSPEASDVKRTLSALKPDEYKSTIEELTLAGQYIHGTHVAGIAVEGNPYARILTSRIEFSHTLLPDPCPTRELADKDARNAQAVIDFMKKNGVRVVNMSWGGTMKAVESDLELCGIGKTPGERKALAREYFDIAKAALTKAFASAPDMLFITAAGNSNRDASFDEDIPADIVLPNLMTVGAVDRAGDEASFTSYGPTVVAHANGYQVESVIPGGERLAESGTSMASPNVANLAAKMLAVNPKLTPAEVIKAIRETADRSPDGRRVLINPKNAVAAAQARNG